MLITRYSNVVRLAVIVLFCLLYVLTVPMTVSAQTPFSCADVTEIPTIECEALVALYNSTDGDNWFASARDGWLQTATPCSWHGVTCSDSGVVTGLNKSDDLLSGTIPAEIGNLTHLTELDLSSGQLSSVPAEIGNLTDLTELDLSYNLLTTVPAEIGNLINLNALYLYNNQLMSIPSEIGNLTSVTALSLSSNQLTSLPAEIGNLTSLSFFNVRSNRLIAIPAEIGNLTDLIFLSVRSNQLITIPAEIGNLTNLTGLSLDSNRLTSLPAEILNLTNLTDLQYDELVCVTADPTDIEAWGELTALAEPSACADVLTSVTLNSAQNRATTAPISMIYFVLFLIGTYGTYAIIHQR